MGQLIEFNRVYRRLEASSRGTDISTTVLPTIEIKGISSVSVYGSNLPRQATPDLIDAYNPPILDSEIVSKMTLSDTGLLPGFHPACVCTTWIAFIPDDENNPPEVYDCLLIDWEFDFRRRQQEEGNC